MPRSFAVNNSYFSMAAQVAISLLVALPMALTLSTRSQAQGPALTTISGTVYRAEDRLGRLERNDLRRTIYDRLVTAAITFAISVAIAWHDHLGLK